MYYIVCLLDWTLDRFVAQIIELRQKNAKLVLDEAVPLFGTFAG